MGDFLLRGLGLDGRVRVVAADTTGVVCELRRIHDPSRAVTTAVGRLATGALLLAASLEKVTVREPMLTLEMDGGGPAGRMFATASPAGWVRAYVARPEATSEPTADGRVDVAAVIGRSGHLVVTRDRGLGRPYRGVVPLHTGEVAQDLAWYLTESEQSPAAVVLGVALDDGGNVLRAGGVMIQLLPGVSEMEALQLTARVEELTPLSDTSNETWGPADWCRELFPDGMEAVEEVAVRFECGCSERRVLDAVRLLGLDEVRELASSLEMGGAAALTCEFCHRVYHVSDAQLRDIERELAAGPS